MTRLVLSELFVTNLLLCEHQPKRLGLGCGDKSNFLLHSNRTALPWAVEHQPKTAR